MVQRWYGGVRWLERPTQPSAPVERSQGFTASGGNVRDRDVDQGEPLEAKEASGGLRCVRSSRSLHRFAQVQFDSSRLGLCFSPPDEHLLGYRRSSALAFRWHSDGADSIVQGSEDLGRVDCVKRPRTAGDEPARIPDPERHRISHLADPYARHGR